MLWLLLTILSYALNAVALVTDKFLLTKKIPNPAVYTIIISLLGVLSAVLLPFGWSPPTGFQLLVELAAGFLFGLALLLMFEALSRGEASRVVPFINGLQPLVILPLAWLLVGEAISGKFLWAFILIIIGSVLITWGKGEAKKGTYLLSVISAIIFGVSLVLSKYAFSLQGSFITPFVMSRVGGLFFAFLLLAIPANFKDFAREAKNPKSQTGVLLILGQTAGALASVLVNLAIALSSNVTAIINALQGLQYVLLLAIVAVLARKFPRVLHEQMSRQVLWQKIIATVLIIGGLAVLAF